ncbi:hypothetical protein M0804_005559 [Polistes exclamans]|nr:hypothetical protein M0804_005559 [Polistes exclamans]
MNLIVTFLTWLKIDVDAINKTTFEQQLTSDITSGGSKKICKVTRYLANFILYVTNKESNILSPINEIHSKANIKQLEELKEKTEE